MIKFLRTTCIASSLFVAVAFASALVASPAVLAGGASHEARHGGIYINNKLVDLEVIAKADLIQVYATEHGKPLKLEGAKAKVTLLNGAEKSEVDLPLVGDKFEAKGAFKVAKGTKGIVLVTLAGMPGTTGRFTVK